MNNEQHYFATGPSGDAVHKPYSDIKLLAQRLHSPALFDEDNIWNKEEGTNGTFDGHSAYLIQYIPANTFTLIHSLKHQLVTSLLFPFYSYLILHTSTL